MTSRSDRQSSTTEDNTKISHRQDPNETGQGLYSCHTQGLTTEDRTKISHRED